jgi:hypothetical protein
MPFIGIFDNEPVTPEEIDDGTPVSCPECDGKMLPRGPFEDGRARHFYHVTGGPDDGNRCSGGESDPHRKMKSLAVSALRQTFPDHTRCEPEVALDVSQTETLPDTRHADTLVEFTTPNRYYGNGIIIETQYRNHTKDLYATTHDYLSLDYSVYWATQDDFATDRLNFDHIEAKFSNQQDKAYAVYNYNPDEFSTELAASLDWDDPHQDCEHDWQHMTDATPSYQSCPSCSTNRIYDQKRTRYLYDSQELLGPTAEPTSTESEWTIKCSRDDGHVWEPYETRVDRCAICNVRKVELVDEWGFGETREIVLPFEYMGNNISELTRNPENCEHSWEGQEDHYQCEHCGLIDQLPW